jgi:hypothetical protein
LPGKKHLFSSEEIQTLELVGTVKVIGQAEKKIKKAFGHPIPLP